MPNRAAAAPGKTPNVVINGPTSEPAKKRKLGPQHKPRASAKQPSAARPRSRHESTEETRTQVKVLSANGVTQDQIASYLKISETTLKLKYRRELRHGAGEILAIMGGKLAAAAMAGNVSAIKFWLERKGDWNTKSAIEMTGPNGEPIRTVSDVRVQITIPDNGRDGVLAGPIGPLIEGAAAK